MKRYTKVRAKSWQRLPSNLPRNFFKEIERQSNPFTRDKPPRYVAPLPYWAGPYVS